MFSVKSRLAAFMAATAAMAGVVGPGTDMPRASPRTAAELALEEAMLRQGVRPAVARKRAAEIAAHLPPKRLAQFRRCRKKLRLARRVLGRRVGKHQKDILRARDRKARSTHELD